MDDRRDPQGPEEGGNNPWMKTLLVWGGIFMALLLVVSMFGNAGQPQADQMAYSDFRAKVAEGSVEEVSMSSDKITGKLDNGDIFVTTPVPGDTTLTDLMEKNGVKFSGAEKEETSLLLVILVQSLPFLLILGIAFFALRQVQKGGGA